MSVKDKEESQAPSKKASEAPRYSILIQWSDADQEYVCTFPEWQAAGWRGHTGGPTYQEAAKKGAALLESYIMWCEQDGKPLPSPHLFVFNDDEDGVQ